MSLDSWVKHQIYLLELERSAEADQLSGKIQTLSAVKAQELGISILHLKVDSSRSTLMGRTSLILRRLDDKPFPSHSFRVGDEALLHSSSGNLKRKNKDEADFVHGVVSKLTLTEITLVTDEVEVDLSPPPLRLDQHASDATYKKMKLALMNLPSLASTTSHPLIKLLFYEKEDVPINPIDSSAPIFPLYNKSLNASQIEAIQLALTLPPLALVQGPPGTGKTSTLVELILQLVRSNMRVLVCAPSNIAVDTILQRLHSFSLESSKRNRNREGPFLRMVRLGHPARIHESILQYCLDSLILDDDGTEIVADVRAEMDTILNALSNARNRSKKAELRSELRSLRKEAKVRESRAVEGILKSRNVVLSTNIGASSRLLKDEAFDVVVIDEAAQALEASCWIPIPLGKSWILFGDHQQLPPTIKSPQAAKAGMDVTLFERIFRDARFAPLCRMLNVQYRMNDLISSWASKSSYDGKLVSDGSVASHTLSDLLIHPDVFEDEVVSNCPMLLIDTSGMINASIPNLFLMPFLSKAVICTRAMVTTVRTLTRRRRSWWIFMCEDFSRLDFSRSILGSSRRTTASSRSSALY